MLKEVYDRLIAFHCTYRLACMIHGSKAFVAKATAILKQDISALPFPKEKSALRLSFWERVIEEDTLDYFSTFVRRGQNSALLKESATEQQVSQYAELFCRLLGSVYGNLHADSPIFLSGLICQPFYFGEKPSSSWLSDNDGKARP